MELYNILLQSIAIGAGGLLQWITKGCYKTACLYPSGSPMIALELQLFTLPEKLPHPIQEKLLKSFHSVSLSRVNDVRSRPNFWQAGVSLWNYPWHVSQWRLCSNGFIQLNLLPGKAESSSINSASLTPLMGIHASKTSGLFEGKNISCLLGRTCRWRVELFNYTHFPVVGQTRERPIHIHNLPPERTYIQS